MVEALGSPLASASLHDDDTVLDYTTDPDLIEDQWHEKIDLFLECGYGKNEPSTVIDFTTGEPNLVRQGAGIFKG